MRYRVCSCVLLTVALATLDRAAADPIRLTVEEAVARAQAASSDVSAGQTDIAVAEADLDRSKALLPSNPYFTTGSQHTTQAGVGPNYIFILSQEFEVGGQRPKRIEAAQQGVEKAAWQLKAAENTLVATVRTGFVQALIGAQRVALAEQGVDAAAELAAPLAGRGQLSDTQRFDLNAARIQESQGRRELAAARRARDTTLGTLRRLMRLSPDQELELVGAPQSEIKELPATAELIARALQQRPDLAALQHATQQADLHLALTKREAVPNITVMGIMSRFENDTLAGGEISVPIPLFHRKSPDIHEAVAARNHAGVLTDTLEATIREEVSAAYRACVVAAGDLLAFQQEIVPRNEENLQLERHQYEFHEITLSEVVASQIELLTARREQLDALQTYNEALIELERVIAGPLERPDGEQPGRPMVRGTALLASELAEDHGRHADEQQHSAAVGIGGRGH